MFKGYPIAGIDHEQPGEDWPARQRTGYALEAAGSAVVWVVRLYFFWKRSTRPALSTNFCFPVKNGWQLEQISTCITSLL
jgi:hypothetical protein